MTVRDTPGNLPAGLPSFVNRRAELSESVQLLSAARLVTLAGPAGVGKTRLALEVAQRVRRAFPDGAWFVQFVGLHNPALVAHTVAYTIGIHDGGAGDPRRPLMDFLRTRHLLLVLDNCEHLVESVAELCHDLLRTAGDVRVLVTSRQVLDIAGECVCHIRPFLVPLADAPAAQHPSSARPDGYEAVLELFALRAAAVRPAFAITEDNRGNVLDICRRLDGIPLAIELAAAWLQALEIEQVAARLDDRFDLLVNDSPGSSAHRRTLRATLDWSHALCLPEEQVLWARAAVFSGGFDLEAAEEVCAGDGISRIDILDLLYRLVSKSILSREEHHGVGRYRMLDTLREYGLDRLRAVGDEDRIRRAHAQWYARLARAAERAWFGPDQVDVVRGIRRNHDNLRTALAFLLRTEPDTALDLCAALWFHWIYSGRAAEGQLWINRALAVTDQPTRSRARGLWVAAFLASIQGDLDHATELCAQAQTLAKQVGDRSTEARVVHRLGTIAIYRGDIARAQQLLSEALSRYDLLDDPDEASIVLAHCGLANVLEVRGDLDEAAGMCQRTAELCRGRGDQVLRAVSLVNLARIERLGGNLDEAARLAREVLHLSRSLPNPPSLTQAVEVLAWITTAAGQSEHAAMLLGAADRAWRNFGLVAIFDSALFRQAHEGVVAALRRVLGEAAFGTAFQRGALLDVEDVLAHVGGGASEPIFAGLSATADARKPPLTPREEDVARLVAGGLSNIEIAKALLISRRTAESHIEHILTKLGLGKRAQIAAWFVSNREGIKA